MGPLQLLVPLAQGTYGEHHHHSQRNAAERVVEQHVDGVRADLLVRERHYEDEAHRDDYDEGKHQPDQRILRAFVTAPAAVDRGKAGYGIAYDYGGQKGRRGIDDQRIGGEAAEELRKEKAQGKSEYIDEQDGNGHEHRAHPSAHADEHGQQHGEYGEQHIVLQAEVPADKRSCGVCKRKCDNHRCVFQARIHSTNLIKIFIPKSSHFIL